METSGSMKSAIFCRSCGTQLLEDAIFCHNCGQPQKEATVPTQQPSSLEIVPSVPSAHDPLPNPQPPLSNALNPTGHLSRRTVVLGLAGAATIAIAGGSLTWAALSGK